MNAASGLFPAAAFFAAYLAGGLDFYIATAVLMIAVCVQIAAMKLLRKPVKKEMWALAAMVLVFGGATLLLRDEFYLKIKTTIVYWLFASALLIAELKFNKNPARALLDSVFTAPDAAWRSLTLTLAAFFAALGAFNLLMLRLLTTEEWVWVKTFGYPALTFCFLIAAFIRLHKAGGEPKQ